MKGWLRIVGLGPGSDGLITPEAQATVADATDIVGYFPYVARVPDRPGLVKHASDNRVELERAQHALQLAPLVVNEVMVLGSRCGPFGPALASLEKEAIPVLSLVDSVFSLRDGLSALEKAREKGTMKVLLQP